MTWDAGRRDVGGTRIGKRRLLLPFLSWVATGLPNGLTPSSFEPMRATARHAMDQELARSRAHHLQAEAVKALIVFRRGPSLAQQLRQRVEDGLLPSVTPTIQFFDDLVEQLNRVDHRIGVNCIKTLVNGWHTSHRMPEVQKLECCLGCAARDETTHYCWCPRLWQMINAFL